MMPKAKQAKETKATYAVRGARTNGAHPVKRRASAKRPLPPKRILGKYIVADPEICHGKVTFIGTRIFVSDVIEMVADEMSWEKIISEYHGHITKEAIAEAIGLAYTAFRTYVDKPESKSLSL